MKTALFIGFLFCLGVYSQETSPKRNQRGQSMFSPKPSSAYSTLTEDGAWCWFSDPRAIALNGKMYASWVTSDGSVVVASYDEASGKQEEVNLYPKFNKDDHANPSLLVLPDNRIMVFFTAHSSPGQGEEVQSIHYVTSVAPEDITRWETPQHIFQNSEGDRGFCYTNPVLLSEENNRIYIFWRGGNFKPTFCYTDDLGKSWSKVFTLIESKREISKRPYIKITGNGRDEIHFAFTDGHPRNEPFNSIYYVKYKAGNFYKADGSLLGSMETLPLKHEECDVVYNAPAYFNQQANGVPAWIWDIAVDEDHQPAIVYAKLPTESEHRYWYSKWNGTQWQSTKISNAGAWFPRFPKTKSMREPEPHYSGGVYLDHDNTDIVYYSKPVDDVFEIFKASIKKTGDGFGWEEKPITKNSEKDNVRPYTVRNAKGANTSRLLWMRNEFYRTYIDYKAQIKMLQLKEDH